MSSEHRWARNYPDPEAAIARMEKYGSTLCDDNIRSVIDRIEDYPEIVQAVIEHLNKEDG